MIAFKVDVTRSAEVIRIEEVIADHLSLVVVEHEPVRVGVRVQIDDSCLEWMFGNAYIKYPRLPGLEHRTTTGRHSGIAIRHQLIAAAKEHNRPP